MIIHLCPAMWNERWKWKQSTEFILRNCCLFSPIRETLFIHDFLYQVFWPFLVFRWKIQSICQKVRWPSLSHLLNIAASSTPKPVQTSLFSGRVHLIHPFVFVSLHCTITLCYFMSIKRETEVWITSSLWKTSWRFLFVL
jgi:hypothetical protein